MSRLCRALCRCLLWAAIPSMASASAGLDAGINADVEIGIAQLSGPCGLQGGDRVELLVLARNMVDVKQVLFKVGWRPAGAVASVGAVSVSGLTSPGGPETGDDRAEWGMASLGDLTLAGESELARFAFELAPHIAPETEVDIWISEVSLGPSSTERDIIRPIQAMVLSNYCDGSDQILERAAVVTPEEASREFSQNPRGQVADGSEGEILLSARIFHNGSFLADQELVWTIDNQGFAPLYVLAAEQVLRVDQGGSRSRGWPSLQ